MEPSMHSIAMDGASSDNSSPTARYATALLELFYPIHYRGNMAVEDAMRGTLTRKQAAILWLIRSAGVDNGRCMRRKDIVSRLQDWFEVSSPSVTQTLRGMARPPLGLVRLVEDPNSAREKRVLLTAKGERVLSTMVERGHDFLQRLAAQLPENQLSAGVEFLRAAVAAFERFHEQNSLADEGSARKQRSHARRRNRTAIENGYDLAE
jgi:DNA-binding MarR family transcriptional regulator